MNDKAPAIICFAIGGVFTVIGLSLIGTSKLAVSMFIILGIVLVCVGLALYPWRTTRRQNKPKSTTSVLASVRSRPRPRRRVAKTVSWPHESQVAQVREFRQEQPAAAVAAAAEAASAAAQVPVSVPEPARDLQTQMPTQMPMPTPRYEPPFDDQSVYAQPEMISQPDSAPAGPIYYTPGQAQPYYRTPDEIAEERQIALSRPNTPELERKRRMGELAEIAATLKQERNIFSVPV